MLILFLALTSSGSTLSAPSSAAEILARYEASVDYWYCIHGTAGIIVGTKPGSEQEVAKFFTTLGAKATCMPSQPYVAVACEDGCQDLLAPSMVQAITPLVESVEPDCIIRIQDQLTDDLPLDLIRPLLPTGTQENAVWGLDRIDQREQPLNDTYDYGNADGSSEDGAVVVYVLDTGDYLQVLLGVLW